MVVKTANPVKSKIPKIAVDSNVDQASDGVDPVGNKSPKATADLVKSKRISDGVDIKKLLESGAHFGHKTSRWHPKMAPYIHSKRDGAYIIDLTKTQAALEEALKFISKTASEGKQVLMVGTKRQAKDIVKKLAEDTGMPYVSERWIGGMLTNQKTIGARIKYLKDLESKVESGQLVTKYSKLEVQRFQEEIDSMNILYGGIKNLDAKPGAVFIVDVGQEHNAIKEARILGLKIVAMVDTNGDPSLIDYPIPANDDAIKTIQLITDYVKQAICEGKSKHKPAPAETEKSEKFEKTEEEE